MTVNGPLLDVVARLGQPMPRSELLKAPSVSSEAWLDRRVGSAMVAAGLVWRERRGRATVFGVREASLARAAAALVEERPDIRDDWKTNLPLRVLLTLPLHDTPAPWAVADCSERAWWLTLGNLQDSAFVVRPSRGPRQHIVNPRIAPLVSFLRAYRAQLAEPPDDLAEVPVAQVRSIHCRGAEAAWRLPFAVLGTGYQLVGPRHHPEMAGLSDTFMVAYAGARSLDSWDHALLYAKAHARALPGGGIEVEPRVEHLLAFLAGRRLSGDDDFRTRAVFYGLGHLPDRLEADWVHRTTEVEAFARSGAEGGFLDRRR